MLLNLTNYSTEPIYNQIVKQILIRILEEDKLPGDELEPIWKISRQHHIRSGSIKKAVEAGKVRTQKPLILVIDGKQAIKDGLKIYQAGKDVYITDKIDADYISKLKESESKETEEKD